MEDKASVDSVVKNVNSDTRSVCLKNEIGRAKMFRSKWSVFFFTSVVVLNLIALILAWVIESNVNGVVQLKDVVASYNWNYFYLIISVLLIVYLLKVFVDYLNLYIKNKQHKFLSFCGANIKNDFYNNVTLYCKGCLAFVLHMYHKGVDCKVATDVAYGKRFIKYLSLSLYGFVVLAVGCVLKFKTVPVFMFVIGIIAFLINCLFVLFVLYFDKSKNRYIYIVGAISKFLYKIKLVKDYEAFYNSTLERLVIYNSSLRVKKVFVVLQIVSNIVIQILKHFIVFAILHSLCNADWTIVVELLFKCVILDMAISVLPLPNGTAVFELMFIMLFGNLFAGGYVMYGLILYRAIEYFLPIVIYFVYKLFALFAFVRRKSDVVEG